MMSPDTVWLELAGLRAVVTGGGGGIGRAAALKLLDAGVETIVLDQHAHAYAQTVHDAARLGFAPETVVCDVADSTDVKNAARAIGPVDLLVNTAGIVGEGDLLNVDAGEWATMLSVNLSGSFHTAQAFAPGMIARGGGAMVHIASIAATHPRAHSSAYSASKAGLKLMSQQLAFELGPSGIRSNTISPGMVRTPRTETNYLAPDLIERRHAAVPLGRVARPCDIADVVLFTLSPRARYITGADIVVDGGLTQTLMSHITESGG